MKEEFDDKDFDRAMGAYIAYERKEILKCMFSRYKQNKEFCDDSRWYFGLWLKTLICLLLNWRRNFDYKDNTVVVCTTDEEYGYESSSWIACEVHRSPFVWGISIYNDGN